MLSAQSYSNGFNLHHLWHEPSFLYRDQNTPSQSTNRPGHEAEDGHQGRAGRNHEDNKSNPPMNVYTILRQEENALETRKQNLQRFGAGWIRVPGNPKTYQQMMDERVEREEIELQAQREQAALDAQAAMEHQQRLEQQATQAGMETEQGQDAGEGERDLDNEIPDAASLGNDDDWSEDDEDHEDELPQQEGNGDYAGIVTPAQTHAQPVVRRTRSSLFMDRNLDSDMPDGGDAASEYEHTDTDMESASSEDEAIRSRVRMRQMLPSTSARESLVEQDGSVFGGGSLRESVGNVSLQAGGLSMHGRLSLPSSLLDSSPLAPSRRGGRRR